MELSEAAARALIQRTARLLAKLSDEIGERPLVLPTAEFFPDAFQGDHKSLKRLVRRMQKHAGLSDVPIRTVLIGEDGEAQGHSHGGGGCGGGGCAAPAAMDPSTRLVEDADGWMLNVQQAELGHPVALTASIARALGTVFLLETQTEERPIDEPVEVTVDVAAVALGFGELLLEASHIYSKGCGGPRVAKVTALGCPEIALLCALFVARGGHSPKAVLKQVEVTQREAFGAAIELVESNRALVNKLREAPADLGEGGFALEQAKPWLARVLGKKRRGDALAEDASLEELESMFAAMPVEAKKPRQADPERDELRALVDEAFAGELESARVSANGRRAG